KYKVAEFRLSVAATDHPITQGVGPLEVRDEVYYALKTSPKSGRLTPLVAVPLDNTDQMVGWAWERQDGGRSFGFSGLHFHANWSRPEYRRLVAQGILWTLKQPIPNGGLPVPATEEDLKLP